MIYFLLAIMYKYIVSQTVTNGNYLSLSVSRWYFCYISVLLVFFLFQCCLHLRYVEIILGLIWVSECPPCRKELLMQFRVCSFYIMSICNLSYFPFLVLRFLVLIIPVPGHCLLFIVNIQS